MSKEQEVQQNLAERLMAMGHMAASMAHEIRNPLGSMELFCTLLKKDLEEKPDLKNLADQMHEGIRSLNRIISNCLEFTRDASPRYSTVSDVPQFLENIVQSARAKADQKKVIISFANQGEGSLEIDPYLIKQAFLNLILNAVDAVHHRINSEGLGKFDPRVQVISDLRKEDQWIVLINDNGIGISKENLENIFEPFYTTKEDGTGLGLAITHSLIAAHQGQISIQSELGEGTSITISLPRFAERKTEACDAE